MDIRVSIAINILVSFALVLFAYLVVVNLFIRRDKYSKRTISRIIGGVPHTGSMTVNTSRGYGDSYIPIQKSIDQEGGVEYTYDFVALGTLSGVILRKGIETMPQPNISINDNTNGYMGDTSIFSRYLTSTIDISFATVDGVQNVTKIVANTLMDPSACYRHILVSFKETVYPDRYNVFKVWINGNLALFSYSDRDSEKAPIFNKGKLYINPDSSTPNSIACLSYRNYAVTEDREAREIAEDAIQRVQLSNNMKKCQIAVNYTGPSLRIPPSTT